MAKVGSTAVLEALQRRRLRPYHVHRMNAEHIARMLAGRRAKGWYEAPLQPHDRYGPLLRESIIRRGKRVRVVTLVRDPIARNLSSYFEHLDAIWSTRDAHEKIAMDELCRGFFERYTHDEPLTWFDDELLPVLGIDVYQLPFPAEGHLVIRTPQCELLILKAELSDAQKSAALSRFFGMRGIDVRRANDTGTQSNGEAFRRFIEAIRLTPDYVDRMLDSRYTRHFYGDEERVALRRRWLRASPA
ncbi:MAG: hypothetical protein JO197_18705 [Acidobacteria bacterium]|nr:hypothetical protein [Acidobacteriota bacterium]MBV9477163.1 hypothetical protein [Acidobacteriota bacterium]